MSKILTTLTPYWGRPDALARWIVNINAWRHPRVRHLLLDFSDYRNQEEMPAWPQKEPGDNFDLVKIGLPPDGVRSIGDGINAGAMISTTDWIMKLDVDMMPHEGLWEAIVNMIEDPGDQEWFNLGAVYLLNRVSIRLAEKAVDSLRYARVIDAIDRPKMITNRPLSGTQFICRRRDYLAIGGTDPGFRGYAWEDYSIVFRLNRLSKNPRPISPVRLDTTTRTLKTEIVEPMAKEAFERDRRLTCLHHYHPPLERKPEIPCHYKHPTRMADNKERLYALVSTSSN